MIARRLLIFSAAAAVLVVALAGVSRASEPVRKLKTNEPPKGYTALFNGKDLAGWVALAPADGNPHKLAEMTAEQRDGLYAKHDPAMREHWTIESGELVNDGGGPYLTTAKNYRDFELLLEYKTVPMADGGIYLRGTPQVQIWDSTEEGGKVQRGADKGSGGLFNNQQAGKDPLVRADKPFGEWNDFRIRMVGEDVSVWFNGNLVVNNVPLENYWDRDRPVIEEGPIQLQTHGGEIRYRNVFIRELEGEHEFTALFGGNDLSGWTGATDGWQVENASLVSPTGGGGNLFTKEQYGDFVFRFDFLLDAGGNNGVGIRCDKDKNAAYDGMEIQILDDASPQYAGIQPWQAHGSIYGVVPAKRGFLNPPGVWNFEEIKARGNHITVTLNGTVIVDADIAEAARNGTIDGKEHPGLFNKSGHIGFLGHGHKLEFRHMRIKELK